MGMKLTVKAFDEALASLSDNYRIYAPVAMQGKNTFTDVELVGYEEVHSIKAIEFNKKSLYSSKEIVLPITQTLFYFTEDQYIEPGIDDKGIIVFLRSCDIHSYKRLDEIYLRNKFEDKYYKVLRNKVKYALIGCEKSFENCFCVSMGSNKTEDYSIYVKPLGNGDDGDHVLINIKDADFIGKFHGQEIEVNPDYVTNNDVEVNISSRIDYNCFENELWREYDNRCIACGRCNFVCPTCTCNAMQDIFYKDNKNNGERRRVWASCHVDGYTDMAGGHNFRKLNGDRMRFKVLHKVYDFKKRFGYHMCTGCGRCDDVCPQYISFSSCINKLSNALDEVE